MKKKMRKIMQISANKGNPYSQSLQSLDSVPSLGWRKAPSISLFSVGFGAVGSVRVASYPGKPDCFKNSSGDSDLLGLGIRSSL